MKKIAVWFLAAAWMAIAAPASASVRPWVDDEDERYELADVARVKMEVCPTVKGKADVLGFFDAINESYWVEQWQVAHVYLHPEEDDGLGDNCAWETVLDKKNGYLRVSFGVGERNPKKNFVECACWNQKNGKKLVALNFDYEQKEDDQIFTKGKASDVLFYEYDPEYKMLQPIEPPVKEVVDLKGVRLPREGRDLKLPGGKKLWWSNGIFTTENPAKRPMNGTPSVPELVPSTIGPTFDFSPEAVKNFEDEMRESIYDILGGGCSFYCGCEIGKQKASSTLKAQGKFNYVPNNAHDLSYYTAWVEGAADYGVGEWIEYTLPANNPRITSIGVVNGIVRSKKAWEENSRVKALEVLVNGKKHAMLYLKDVYAEQWFDVPTIGYNDREHLNGKAPLVIRFRICEVYPGTKYKDTGITEIYFDGIDVH